jgi:hypothetical protein
MECRNAAPEGAAVKTQSKKENKSHLPLVGKVRNSVNAHAAHFTDTRGSQNSLREF